MSHKAFLTIPEFHHLFGPCRTKTYELIKSKAIVAVKVGRRTYIDYASALAWAAGLPRL